MNHSAPTAARARYLVACLAAMPAVLSAQTWSQLSPTGATPQGRIYHTLAYDSVRDRGVLFGGLNGTSATNDTWEWAPLSNTWTQLSPASSPSARQVMAFAFDASRGRTVVWGGFNGTFLSDTWEWDGTNWQQLGASPFAGRCAATMVYDSKRQKCILFGGQAQSSFTNDVWQWDGTAWTQLAPSVSGAAGPAPRFYQSMVYDSREDRVVVFGGANGSITFRDTWAWSPATAAWTQLSNTGPSARSQAAMIYEPRIDRVVLYDGESPSVQPISDTWILAGNTWTLASDAPPPARRRHVIAYRPGTGKSLMFGGQQTGGVIAESWQLDTSSNAVVDSVIATEITTTGGPAGVRDHAVAALPSGGVMLFGGATSTGLQPVTFTLSGTTFTPEYPKFSPVYRTEHSLMYDPVRQENLLFGGKNPVGTPLSATWIWANGNWELKSVAVAPSARSGHRMSFDRQAGVGLLFGGENAQGTALNDFWSWNGTAWTQLTPTTLPPVRSRHGMAFDALRNRTIVYGGKSGTTLRSDVWEWDGTNWAEASSSARPSERHAPVMSYDTTRGRMVLFGGRDNANFLADTWEIERNDGPINPGLAWTQTNPVIAPPARNSAASAFDPVRNRVVMFGGFEGTTQFGDTWTYDVTTQTWLKRQPVTQPSGKSAPSMCFQNARNKTLLFGGFNAVTGQQQETWEWDGLTWAQLTTTTTPPARMFAPIAYDTARSRAVMFGGLSTTSNLGDTWEFDGTNWINRTPAGVSPSARLGAMLTYDPIRNQTVLFGGTDATGATSETWVWNGSTWTQRTPTNSPPARVQGAMAFDAGIGKVILFGGGTTNWLSNYSDTWQWDGTNWSLVPLRRADGLWNPGAREGHSMAYDPQAERVVVHGGSNAVGTQGDLWSWNGREWSQHLPSSGAMPRSRTGAQLVQDDASNRLILVGGGNGSTFFGDVWQFSLPAYGRVRSYGAPCVGPSGPLTLATVNQSRPIVGQNFAMEMSNVPTFAPCLGFVGFSDTLINGVPLPLNLDFISLFGCFAYMSGDKNFSIGLPNNATRTTPWNLQIPLDPAFLAFDIYCQGLALEFGGTRRATMTNALAVHIGDR